jgi:PTH1 family peptidyl-tRNA hydrolase
MNISGKGVKTAWNSFMLGLESEEKGAAVLVIVHDELEVALGKVKVKKTGSAGGHNGLISITQQFQTKVGIGDLVVRFGGFEDFGC